MTALIDFELIAHHDPRPLTILRSRPVTLPDLYPDWTFWIEYTEDGAFLQAESPDTDPCDVSRSAFTYPELWALCRALSPRLAYTPDTILSFIRG